MEQGAAGHAPGAVSVAHAVAARAAAAALQPPTLSYASLASAVAAPPSPTGAVGAPAPASALSAGGSSTAPGAAVKQRASLMVTRVASAGSCPSRGGTREKGRQRAGGW